MTLKLGYLVPEFPSQTHSFFWREIAALERLGVDVALISTRPPNRRLMAHDWSETAIARTTYLAPLSLPAMAAGIPAAIGATLTRGIPAEDRAWYLRNAGAHAPFARRLVQVARAGGLDHIHVHSCARAALVAMLARRMGAPPYSLTLHGPLRDYGPGQRTKWQDASFATVITERLRTEIPAELLGIALPQIIVQPMGVDTDLFRRHTPYEPPRRGETVRIFSCGRLNYVKGHQFLVEAVAILAARGIDARLEIAGEDEQGGTGFHRELDRLVALHGVADRVTLCGAIGEDAVRDRLLGAHIFALASLSEPLGVAYMEAMSCEVPVIGTDAGGVPELITDGHDGILVPPQQPSALAASVERLLSNPDTAQRIGKAARGTVSARFSAQTGARTLIEAISRTAGRRTVSDSDRRNGRSA